MAQQDPTNRLKSLLTSFRRADAQFTAEYETLIEDVRKRELIREADIELLRRTVALLSSWSDSKPLGQFSEWLHLYDSSAGELRNAVLGAALAHASSNFLSQEDLKVLVFERADRL